MGDDSHTLFLARHGETDFNRKRLMQGRSIDASLNERGLIQAEALAERFSTVPLAAVYSSTLQRAKQTADRVAVRHGIESNRLESVVEMWWGDLEGRSIDEVADYLDDVGEQWRRGEFDHRVGGGETILDVQVRARAALTKLAQNHTGGEAVLVVTHGRFLRVLLATALAGADLTQMDEYRHSNTGVYQLEYSPFGYSLSVKNCTTHLDAMDEVGS